MRSSALMGRVVLSSLRPSPSRSVGADVGQVGSTRLDPVRGDPGPISADRGRPTQFRLDAEPEPEDNDQPDRDISDIHERISLAHCPLVGAHMNVTPWGAALLAARQLSSLSPAWNVSGQSVTQSQRIASLRSLAAIPTRRLQPA